MTRDAAEAHDAFSDVIMSFRARCTSLTKWLTSWLTIWLSVDALQETLTLG